MKVYRGAIKHITCLNSTLCRQEYIEDTKRVIRIRNQSVYSND